MDWIPPAFTVEIVAAIGGGILGWVFFRYLPGMKTNAYKPRVWVPVSLIIMGIAYFTYVLPQFMLPIIDNGEPFWGLLLFETLVFFTYAVSSTITLLLLQLRRETYLSIRESIDSKDGVSTDQESDES